ncbi:DNA primase large subunit [Nosema bombycis CQ1]|uniref:DNA primase large subunit n=1 Tax=Nosema bombycis (strain CQ1 / CVCC 102059) TaxID=578461 RepID=R0MCD4_NOSB1|nr:DNA primase large subunit [Nosema bombycis CQ1]|eukprot:EOB11710.1 DNA primase large subunit [Nosema bombycis CQ1]
MCIHVCIYICVYICLILYPLLISSTHLLIPSIYHPPYLPSTYTSPTPKKKMKRLKSEKLLLPNFYFELNTSQISQAILLNLLQKRIKILRMVEDGACDLRNLKDFSEEEDILSHFIMRMVCYQIEWVYKWFIGVESKFFKLKLGNLENLEGFFKGIIPKFKGIEINDDEILLTRRSYISNGNGHNNLNNSSTILVHFTKLVSIFGKRQIKVKGGYCQLDQKTYSIVLVNEFKSRLSKWTCPKNDSRLIKICRDFFLNTPPKKADLNFTFKITDKKFYPPCILLILDQLAKVGHLKYNDRQALTLFLKGIGMSLEECTEFISSKFSISKSDFNKQYLYNIRHNYGLEGKKADYSCYSCQKMAFNKNTANKSGCPYVDNKEFIKEYSKGIDIEDIYKEGGYTSRCTKVLEKITKEEYKKVVTTPVKYFVTYKKAGSELAKE